MNRRRLGIAAVIGALVSLVLTTLMVPNLLSWYFEPAVNPGCSCGASIRHALHLFRVFQLIALSIGAVFGAILAYRFRRLAPPASDA